MTPWTWPWISYQDSCWAWPADEVGGDYFDNDEALERAIVVVAVRSCLRSLDPLFPERPLISLVGELRRAVEIVQADLVAEARVQGISWTRIGTALGVGRTAAQKRYGQGLSQERQDQLEEEARAAMEWAGDVIDTEDGDHDPEVAAADSFLLAINERRADE
jgi:hypothetical protein